MSERPIIFNDDMVRAILAGTKTQTRRPVKPQPPSVESVRARAGIDFSLFRDHHATDVFRVAGPVSVVRDLVGRSQWNPPCLPGDTLWVQEAFNIGRALRDCEGIVDDEMLWEGPMPKNDPRGVRLADDWGVGYRADGCPSPHRPSIHMPRWASRITLRVTDVRVERVHAISEEDARAEGFVKTLCDCDPCASGYGDGMRSAGSNFARAWDGIYAAKGLGWDANPWVWVVAFEVAR